MTGGRHSSHARIAFLTFFRFFHRHAIMTDNNKNTKKKKYEYEFDRSFDFEAAPDPPQDYNCILQWNHQDWDKSLCNLVMSRAVREDLFECHGCFPTFAAPELLNEQQFRKMCFYADKDQHVSSNIPKGYLPMAYLDCPDEWEEHRRQEKERREAFKKGPMSGLLSDLLGIEEESDDSESPSESEDDRKPAATVSKDTKRPGSPNAQSDGMVKRSKSNNNTLPTMRLLDMDDHIRSVLASFLDPINWCHLRETCRDATEWPLPTVDYDIIYFAINNGFDCMFQGVAFTVEDVREAINALNRDHSKDLWNYSSELTLELEIVKFDRVKHSIAPLMTFKENQYVYDPEMASLHDLGRHYFGVKQAFPVKVSSRWSSLSSFTIFAPENPSSDPVFEDDSGLLRYNGLKPKNPMNLEHIGIRKVCCTFCGGDDESCECALPFGGEVPGRIGPGGYEGNEHIIYYSPVWFGNGKNRLLCSGSRDARNSWLVFKDTVELYNIL